MDKLHKDIQTSLRSYKERGGCSALNVGVWNIMQQPWIKNWTSLVNSNILNNDLHVLQLVEVWTREERDIILSLPGLKQKFPHTYWPTERPDERVGCDPNNSALQISMLQFLGCLQLTDVNTTQIIQPLAGPLDMACQMSAVGLALMDFPCLTCLINELQYSDVPTATTTCNAGKGSKYAYKGVNGQLILSRFPIVQIKETFFDSWIANRVNIHAKIRDTTFSFGHFAYNLLEDISPYLAPLMYGDTQPQQSQDMLLQGSDIVMGDLNTGPDYQPQGYNILLGGGYENAFSSQEDTYCPVSHASFPLCSGQVGQTIDHILVKNNILLRATNASYFNIEPLMSDHIGVRAKVCKWEDAK